MRDFILDCIEDEGENSKDKKTPATITLRPKDELFAFRWPELPSTIKNKVANWIRQWYGVDLGGDEVKRIFKCLVARDIEIPLPYIEKHSEKVNLTPSGKVQYAMFNEETFEYDSVEEDIESQAYDKTFYVVFDYKGKTGEIEGIKGEEGYTPIGEWDEWNKLKKFPTKEEAEAYCINLSVQSLIKYTPGEIFSGTARMKLIKGLDERDWERRNQTYRFTKAMFMANPRKFDKEYPEWTLEDDILLDTIKTFRLSTKVEQEFIDWILVGCREINFYSKKLKLTKETAKDVKNQVVWGWLGRGNIVQYFHGFPCDMMDSLSVGTVFSAKVNGHTNRYVVFKVDYDETTKLIGYAKEGTAMNDNGQMDSSEIKMGLSADLIEDCWDELYDVNRVGKKKKILREVKIVG